MTRITRIEVITNNGREYVSWEDDNDVSYMLQDSNRTLKIFVGKAPPEQPITEEENERYFEEAKQIVENHFAKKKMTETEQLKAEIKMLEKKLSFLEEIENHKTPCEEAYKNAYGVYPNDEITYNNMWSVFQKGYYAAQKDYKVGEYQEEPEEQKWDAVRESVKWCEEHPDWDLFDCLNPQTEKQVKKLQEKDWEIKVETDYLTGKARHKTKIVDKDGNDYKPEPLTTEELFKPNWKPKPQEPEEVAEGLSTAFREAVKQGVVSSVDTSKESWMDKPIDELVAILEKNPPECLKFQLGKTLEQLIERWWCDVFSGPHENWSMEECISDLCDRIFLWLPKEQNSEGTQRIETIVAVDTHNELLRKIKSKIHNKKDT